jgi:hypothetical protein
MSSWWYDSFKGFIGQAYEFLNNEESIGESFTEIISTMQTGYPRFVLNNFSVEDLLKFLDHPCLDSFFILVKIDSERLDYAVVYKSHFRSYGRWFASTVIDEQCVQSKPLIDFITGKEKKVDFLGITDEYDDDDLVLPSGSEEHILLLRPKTGSFSQDMIRKTISHFESKGAPYPLTSEHYVFYHVLHQPEYLDSNEFSIIREKFYRILQSNGDVNTAAKLCKHVMTLFDDCFHAYKVGLLL